MASNLIFFLFIPILCSILLLVSILLAPHNPYAEKASTFECGFHSFLGQNRSEFSISFFVFALLFLLFDLEILLIYPFVVSAYTNAIYGLVIVQIFFLTLTLGFAFEYGKKALYIDSKQYVVNHSNVTSNSNDSLQDSTLWITGMLKTVIYVIISIILIYIICLIV